MKKVLIALGILVVLGGLAWFALQRNANTTSVDTEDANFAVEDTAAIDRISISNKATGKVFILKKLGQGNWVLNDSLKLSFYRMQLLLSTLQGLRMKRPLSEAETKTAIEEIATHHDLVHVYSGDKLLRGFYMGPEADENMGNYALVEGAERPYVVYLLHFSGYPGAHFQIDPNHWRDKQIFRSSAQTLQRIVVQQPAKPAERLVVNFKNSKFAVEGATNIDTTRLIDFLIAFRGTFAEQYIDDAKYKDSLLHTTPGYIIELEDIDKTKSNTLWLYPAANPEDDVERMIGYLPKQKTAITLQTQNFKPIAHGLSWIKK